jgi:hypothetical protein
MVAKGKYQKWLTPDGLTLLEAWARDGLTDKQIAHNMSVNVATLYRYKQDHCDICNALKKGKEIVDIEVENALLKRAKGYKFTEKKVETNEQGEQKITETIKEVVPDTTAQIFWLKNRKPEQWRDKQPEQHGTDDDENDNLYNAISEAVKKREV